MKLLLTLTALVLACACSAGKPFEEMSPEERAAYLQFQQDRIDVYAEFARENAQKFVTAGKWKQEDVNLAFTLAEEAKNAYFIWKSLGPDATLEQQYAARLAAERAVFKFVSLGIDRALE